MSVLYDFAFVSFFYIQKFKIKKILLWKNWVHIRKKNFMAEVGFEPTDL